MTSDLTPLANIPESILPSKIKSIQFIKGGLNNRNILINKDYLLKEYLQRDEKNDPIQLRYSRERTALKSLTNFKFMPKFFSSYEQDNRFFIARNWINGKIMDHVDLESNLNSLITTLSSLHKLHYTCEADFDYFDVLDRYLREYKDINPPQKENFPEYRAISSFYKEKREELDNVARSDHITRLHGDLVFSNIIQSNHDCILIDWEYTTIGDPLLDLAYLVTQNSIPPELEKRIINLYAHHNSINIDFQAVSLYKNLMNLMSTLWYALQVFRMKNNAYTFPERGIPSSKFLNLARLGFSSLNIQ